MCKLHKAVLVYQLGCTLNSVSYKLYYLFQGLKYLHTRVYRAVINHESIHNDIM